MVEGIARSIGRARIETTPERSKSWCLRCIARSIGRARIETRRTWTYRTARGVSPDQLVGRGLKLETAARVDGSSNVSPDQIVGRGLKRFAVELIALKLCVSPDQLVGRGLKSHQVHGSVGVPQTDCLLACF